MVWLYFQVTQQIINSSNVTIVSSDSVFYDLQQTGSTGVLIRLTSNELTENSTLPQLSSVNIPELNGETKLFIPGCKLQYITFTVEHKIQAIRVLCI